jgi:hypothetical protein
MAITSLKESRKAQFQKIRKKSVTAIKGCLKKPIKFEVLWFGSVFAINQIKTLDKLSVLSLCSFAV